MFYQSVGNVPPKRHTRHPAPGDDGHFFEELMGAEGFSSDSALLYHRHLPSAINAVRSWDVGDLTTTPNQPLLPRHFQTRDVFSAAEIAVTDPVRGRRLLLGNQDVRLLYVAAGADSPWYRDATGDECVFVEAGTARVETVFGSLALEAGDYLILPRGVTHRWLPQTAAPLRLFIIEAAGHLRPPRRYLSRTGQFLEHAPYCERDLRTPIGPLLAEDIGAAPQEPTEIYIKHRSPVPGGVSGTVHTVPFHPLDVVGWDGCFYPYTFNVADFEPLTGRIHQPPPVHQVLEGDNVVICNFVPRKVDYHPLAIPVPYYHANVDSDEVMFYVAGGYEARKGSGIAEGSITLHPGGHTHGPQPGAIAASLGREFFDELAVMVDTFRPLGLGAAGRAVDDGKYAGSWSRS